MSNKMIMPLTKNELIFIKYWNEKYPNIFSDSLNKTVFIDACELKDTEITLLKEMIKELLDVTDRNMFSKLSGELQLNEIKSKYKTELDSIRLKRE